MHHAGGLVRIQPDLKFGLARVAPQVGQVLGCAVATQFINRLLSR
jgi:hypothetical protein